MLPAAGMQRGSRYGGGHRGPTAGLAPGFVQGNPSCPAGERFFAVLPVQSEALSADRHLGHGRSARAGTRRGPRHSLRSAALSHVAELRSGGGIGGRARPLARRSGEFRHQLLVFIRRSADGGGHRTASHRARPQRDDVPHLDRCPRGRLVLWADGGIDAAAETGRCDPRGADHHAFPPCTARQCTSASRN